MLDPEGLAVWPCGTWCYIEEIAEFDWMSDDWYYIDPTDPRYNNYVEAHNAD